jgi:hypothetical protein
MKGLHKMPEAYTDDQFEINHGENNYYCTIKKHNMESCSVCTAESLEESNIVELNIYTELGGDLLCSYNHGTWSVDCEAYSNDADLMTKIINASQL